MAALVLIPHPPPQNIFFSWIRILCQNSFTRKLKIRFVGLVLKKLFTLISFSYNLLIVSITEPRMQRVAVWDFTSFWQFDIILCSMHTRMTSLTLLLRGCYLPSLLRPMLPSVRDFASAISSIFSLAEIFFRFGKKSSG